MASVSSLTTALGGAVAALAGALVLTSCSSSSSTPTASTNAPVSQPESLSATTAASTSEQQSSSPATGNGACSYLTVAQASQLAGSPVKAGVERHAQVDPITFAYCDYIFDPGNAPGVSVAVADLPGDPESLFQQFRAEKQGSDSDFQDVPGVGDAAFYADQNLNILLGDKGVVIYVGRATGSPRGPGAIPDEKAAAEIILPQL